MHKDVEACRRLESTRTHRDHAVHSLHNLGITAKTNTSRFSTALAGNTNTFSSEETDVYLLDLGTFTKIKQNNNKQKKGLEFKHCLYVAVEKSAPNTQQTKTANPGSN